MYDSWQTGNIQESMLKLQQQIHKGIHRKFCFSQNVLLFYARLFACGLQQRPGFTLFITISNIVSTQFDWL